MMKTDEQHQQQHPHDGQELRRNARLPQLENDDLETQSEVDQHDQQHADELAQFPFNTVGLTSGEAAELLDVHGRNELPSSRESACQLLFNLLFRAPMPLMIWAAFVIELIIANFPDAFILLFIQIMNAAISFYESRKAGNAVQSLQSSLQPSATVKRDGEWIQINSAYVVPGDLVKLASGDAVPADCRMNLNKKVEIDVDQAALTGESLPVTFYAGDSVKMGSMVVRGEAEVSEQQTLTTIISTKNLHIFTSPKRISTTGHCRIYRIQYVLWQNSRIASRKVGTQPFATDSCQDYENSRGTFPDSLPRQLGLPSHLR